MRDDLGLDDTPVLVPHDDDRTDIKHGARHGSPRVRADERALDDPVEVDCQLPDHLDLLTGAWPDCHAPRSTLAVSSRYPAPSRGARRPSAARRPSERARTPPSGDPRTGPSKSCRGSAAVRG